MRIKRIIHQTRDADRAHNLATDLDYGYTPIRETMMVAETDPRQQWYGIPGDDDDPFRHAMRFSRLQGEWQIAELTEDDGTAPSGLPASGGTHDDGPGARRDERRPSGPSGATP